MIIEKFIVHVFDKDSSTPVLAEFEGKLSQEMDSFFKKNIKKVFKNDNLRKAIFNDYNNNLIKTCCEQMIYDKKTLIDNSKEIASYLFDVMKATLDSCDLAICIYSNKDQEGIAIMKLEYKPVYTHSIEYEDEKFNIQIVPSNIAIPMTAKIKQAALIELSGINDEYHVRVLDIDAEKEDSKSIFIEEFIEAKRIDDDKHKTKVFKETTDNWITNALSNDIKTAEEVKSFLNYTLMEKEEVDINNLLDEAIDDENLREGLKERLDEKGVDTNTNFNVDKKWLEKKIDKRKVKLDNGFNVTGNLKDFEDPMKYTMIKNDDGTVNIILKNVSFIEDK